MKRKMKRLITLWMIMVMLLSSELGMINVSAVSANDIEVIDVTAAEDELQQDGSEGYKGTSLSEYLMGDNQAEETVLQSESDATEATDEEVQQQEAWGIFNITVSGNGADVSYTAYEDATVLVCLYTEDGTKMIQSESVNVSSQEHLAHLEFAEPVPEYFYMKGFIIDEQTRRPYCDAYSSGMYLKEIQDFLATTVDDYDQEKVLNLDDDKESNFIVFSDKTIEFSDESEEDKLVDADEETAKYTFTNISDNMRNVQVGNIITYYHKETNDLDIIPVGSIEIDEKTNSAVVIRDNRSMEEVLPYIQVDTNSRQETDSYNEEDEISPEQLKIEDTYDLSIPFWEVDDFTKGNISFTFDIKIIKKQEYCQFDFLVKALLELDWAAGVNKKLLLGEDEPLEIPIIYGIKMAIGIQGKFAGKIEGGFYASALGVFGVTANNNNPGNEMRWNYVTTFDPSVDLKASAEGTVGVVLKIGFDFLDDDVVSFSMEVEPRIKVSAVLNPYSLSGLSHHMCTFCIDGSIIPEVALRPVVIKAFKKFWEKDEYIIDSRNSPLNCELAFALDTTNFYYSIDRKEGGFDQPCPYYGYLLEVNVKEAGSGKAIENARVIVLNEKGCIVKNEYDEYEIYHAQKNGFVDEDHVSRWPKTNDKGKVQKCFYALPGDNDILVTAPGYETVRESVKVIKGSPNNIKTIMMTPKTEESDDESGDDDSGSTGGSGGSGDSGSVKPSVPQGSTIVASGKREQISWSYSSDNVLRIMGEDTGISWFELYLDIYNFNRIPDDAKVEKVVISVKNIKNPRYLFQFFAFDRMEFKDSTFADEVTSLRCLFKDDSVPGGARWQVSSIDFGNLNFENITDLSDMFINCVCLKEVDFSQSDLSNVKDMSGMFNNTGFETMDFDEMNIDTHNVEDLSGMFINCKNLKTVNAESIDISNADSINGMFYGCTSLDSLDLSSWDTSNISDMENMFYGCERLQRVIFNPEPVWIENAQYMFYGCKSLDTIDVSNFRGASLFDHMFEGCSSLRIVDMRGFDSDLYGQDLIEVTDMFKGCDKIEKIIVSQYWLDRRPELADKYEFVDFDIYSEDVAPKTTIIKDDNFDEELQPVSETGQSEEENYDNDAEIEAEQKTNLRVTETQDTYDISFSDLKADETYMMYVVENEGEKNSISGNQLLYADLIQTDASGAYTTTFTMTKEFANPYVYVRGLTPIDISQAYAYADNIPYTGNYNYVIPEVICGDEILVEGRDFELTGDVGASEIGDYSVSVNGIGLYSGTLELPYKVYCKHKYSTEWTIDQEATYEAEGSKSRHCTICDQKKNVTVIPKLGSGNINPDDKYDEDNQNPDDKDDDTNIDTPDDDNKTGGENNSSTGIQGTDKQIQNPTEKPADKPTTDSDTTKNALKVGTKFANGGLKYEVIKSDGKDYRVKVVGISNKKMKKLNIPKTTKYNDFSYSVTAISPNAFKGNKTLTKVTIGSNVSTIGNNAFKKCTSLGSVILNCKDVKIGSGAFYGCKKLKSVTIKTKKLTQRKVGKNAFKGIYKKAVIHVPRTMKKKYLFLRKKGLNGKLQTIK